MTNSEGRPSLLMRLFGRISQPELGSVAYIEAPRLKFDSTRIGAHGERIHRAEFIPDDKGQAFHIRQEHPEDELIERIAMVLTHPVMVSDYFTLLEDLGVSTDDADDFVAVKTALLKRL